jgi:hypothetical protein
MARRSKVHTVDGKTVSTLELTVEYENVPATSDLQDIVEKARELGHVTKAVLTIHQATTQDLL